MREPLGKGAVGEDGRELGSQRFLILVVLPLDEVAAVDELAESREELRLESSDGEVTSVGRLVDAVAREPAREEPRDGLAADSIRHEVVRAVCHRDRDPRPLAGSRTLEEPGEDLRDGSERAGREVCDLSRGELWRVLEDAGPAEVVDVVTCAQPMKSVVAESGDRAVDRRRGNVVRPDSQSRGHTGPEAFDDDVGARTERLREAGIGGEVAGDRLAPCPKRRIPGGRRPTHGIARRWLDADDARAEAGQLTARVRARQVPREVDDERPGERLHAGERTILRPLTDRSIAVEERRTLLLDAAVRVFARRGYHGSRVGDIAEEAGVAHGLLYHYFSSKEEVLQIVFSENWGELLARFRAVEEADEPAPEKLAGLAKILLRTWRNDQDLVTVMVREVARSAHLKAQVLEVREAFVILQRVIEQGQREGAFRADLDSRFASWIVYGGLEEVLTGWVLGGLPDSEADVSTAERTAIEIALRGLAV